MTPLPFSRQLWVQTLLASNGWQRTFGLLIFINFVINMIQSQALPEEDTPFGKVFNTLDIVFTAVRTAIYIYI